MVPPVILRASHLDRLAALPPRRAHFRDANGFVFLDQLATDALIGWIELTPEQSAAVRPLDAADKRQWSDLQNKQRENSLLQLCEPCATARLGSDCTKTECLTLGIIENDCDDCGTKIGSNFAPYFVQWRAFFDGGAHAP